MIMLVNYGARNWYAQRNTTNNQTPRDIHHIAVSVCAQIQIEVFLDLEAGDVDQDDVERARARV